MSLFIPLSCDNPQYEFQLCIFFFLDFRFHTLTISSRTGLIVSECKYWWVMELGVGVLVVDDEFVFPTSILKGILI